MSAQAQAVVAAAIKEASAKVKEGANNDTKYGVWYGLNHQPWCAIFVSWCFAQAKATNLIAQTPKGYAGCEAFEAWARKNNMIVPVTDIKVGDILLFDFSKKGKSEHTGIAIADGLNPHTHLIDSCEGNTAGDGAGSQANGDGVYFKHRAPSTIRAVVRPKWSS